jgi:hypothetical protein
VHESQRHRCLEDADAAKGIGRFVELLPLETRQRYGVAALRAVPQYRQGSCQPRGGRFEPGESQERGSRDSL